MNWQEFLQIARKGEGYELKFFGTLYEEDELGPALTGMANTRGGRIIIGFDVHNYHLVGTDLDQKWLENLLKKSCSPQPMVKLDFIEKNDKRIMLITVYTSKQKPFYFKDKCYVLNFDKSKISVMERQADDVEFSDTHSVDAGILTADQNSSDFIVDESTETDFDSSKVMFKDKELQTITDDLLTLTNMMPDTKDEPQFLNFSQEESSIQQEYQVDESSLTNQDDVNDTSDSQSLTFSNLDDIKGTAHVVEQPKQPLGDDSQDLNSRQEKALIYLTQHHSIKNKKYRELYNVSHKTAHLELIDLVKRNLILSQGMGRSTCYVLNAPIQK